MRRLLQALIPGCAFQPDGYWPGDGAAPYATRQVGLWTFMGVICVLFALFGAAYLMRIGYEDWRALPPAPWQLWASTALLTGSGAVWQLATLAARKRRRGLSLRLCLLAWALALAFVASQLGAWQALTAERFGITAGPAAAFFYMLTALHGIHVIGGMIAAVLVMRRFGVRSGSSRAGAQRSDILHIAESLTLCVRYWHLLLGLWLALFALLFWMTPELARAICAAVGIPVR